MANVSDMTSIASAIANNLNIIAHSFAIDKKQIVTFLEVLYEIA